MRLLPLLALVLPACELEGGLHGLKNNPGADDSSTTPSTDTEGTEPAVTPCGDQSAEAIDVALNDACDVPPQQGGFTPVIQWSVQGHMAYGPAAAGQLDDDNGDGVIDSSDIPDIVYDTNTGEGIVCFNGKNGKLKWTSHDSSDSYGGVAIGDVDADGIPEIAASDGPQSVVLLDNKGSLIWRVAIDNADLMDFLYPSIADMDGDGKAEIIAGRNIISYDGRLLGTGKHGIGSVMNQNYAYNEGSASVAVDLDGDGQLEVVVGNAAYRIDGSALYFNHGDDGMPAVADFDGDGQPEVVVVQGNRVWTEESDLTPTGWMDSFANTNYIGPPAIDDLDGDGTPEFVVVGSNQMRAYHWDGTRLWTVPIQDSSGAAGPVLFDFELDGYPEVVYADEVSVKVFNGRDGKVKLDSSDHSSYTGFETPIVADVDADGHVEIVMLHGNGPKGISVYQDQNDTWPAGRQIWNQHAYTITNVNDDATIPTAQAPNWQTYNNFRSGDAGLPPSTWNDVMPEITDVCTKECPDSMQIVVRVWNQGTEEVPAGLQVAVRAGSSGSVVATTNLPDAIPSGRSSQGVVLEVKMADLGGEKPFISVDRDSSGYGTLTECDEDNNQIVSSDYCK